LNPTLSIVTINFNNAAGLKKTIESVLQQSVRPVEFIIIDGGSADGSLEILRQHSENLTWTSEPDNGIYHAQNKGLIKAKGDYILFLNSGDELAGPDILNLVLPNLDGTDIIYGDILIIEPAKEWVKKYNEPLSFGYFLGDTLPHQASFIKRTLFNQTGNFDESLKICSDWKFFIEAVCRHNVSLRYLDFVIARYDFSGISSNHESRDKMRSEKQMILQKEFPRFQKEYEELFQLRSRYPLLANSRGVKLYFKIRNLFIHNN